MALNLHSEAYLNEHQKVLVILKYYKVYLPWLIIKLHKFLNNLIQNNMYANYGYTGGLLLMWSTCSKIGLRVIGLTTFSRGTRKQKSKDHKNKLIARHANLEMKKTFSCAETSSTVRSHSQ